MKLRTAFLALCVLMSSAVVAHADDQVKVRDHRPKKKPKVVKPIWDSTGWTSLGEQTVQGKNDRDTITVGVKDGKFSKITLVVEDSDLELFDIIVHFGNGETYSPTTRHYFKEGSRTGVLDLPGDARYITKVVFKYGNLPGSGKARVQLWGFAVADTGGVVVRDHREPEPPPPPPFTWDNKGWQLLGERQVHGKKDKDTILVGAYEGKFDQLTFVVADSDVEMQKVVVHFGSGKKLQLRFKHVFKEGTRTGVLDLPGNNRRIKKIELKYKNVAGGGRATVQVWGRDTRPVQEPKWDSKGWERLGSVKVDSKFDNDTIELGRDDGRFTKLTFTVEDNDVEIYDIKVVFGNKETLSLKDRLVFREGQRTGAIDLPGEKRFIKRIEFKFGKLARGRNATVAVYGMPAKDDGKGDVVVRDHRTDKPWDDKGWTMLGEQEVNGGNDMDNVVVKTSKTSKTYKKLTLVVLDSDLVLDRIEVAFRKGKSLKVDVGHAFKEGSRTRVIDLPGDKRHITQIVLHYGNLAGGGRAKVQVWGK